MRVAKSLFAGGKESCPKVRKNFDNKSTQRQASDKQQIMTPSNIVCCGPKQNSEKQEHIVFDDIVSLFGYWTRATFEKPMHY